MQQSRDKTPADNAPGDTARDADRIDESLVFVVPAGRTRHGARGHWRESEYARAAMLTIHRGVPPRDVNRTKLWRDVNAWLAKDDVFKATGIGEISRKTVVRELNKLHRQS
jgi:hypothetical protein